MQSAQGKNHSFVAVSIAVDALAPPRTRLNRRRDKRSNASSGGSYPKPSLVKLSPSPLRKLGWVFGLG